MDSGENFSGCLAELEPEWEVSPTDQPTTTGAEKGYGLPLGGSRYLVSGSLDKNVRERFFRAFGPRGRLGESVVELN